MKVPFIDLQPQYKTIRRELDGAFKSILDSQKFILGDYGRALEDAIAKKIGVRHAVGLASGSDALYLALVALGVGPGDEVITTPFSFFATAGSISRTGARPIFADIEADTFNLDPEQVQRKITARTKAILPVHLFGLPADMTNILSIAKKHSIAVIEDAAQSFGARLDGRQSGGIGDVGCFSFYPTKNLGGSGDGGMLVTSSDLIAKIVRMLRDHGASQKYYHEFLGINSRLDEFQAATVLLKLKHIDRWNRQRRKHAAVYENKLKGLPVKLPAPGKGCEHVYHLYSLLSERRDELKDDLLSRGVGCGVYYPVPLHLQPCYKSLGYKPGDLPVTERVCRQILSLPMYAEMSAGMISHVCKSVREFYHR